MGRRLLFQQITDSRFTPREECLPLLIERVEKIKELLDIDGLSVHVGNPYLVDWTEQSNSIQYRADFSVRKGTRKTTWNDIYKLVNNVKAVPYDFK